MNGTWTNGTINTYYNSTVVPHGWSNITVWAYNNSGNGSLSSISVSQDIQLANNAPFQYLIGNRVVNENENLQFNVTATDADLDQITYGTNATKGTFNATTGNFSWTPAYGDAGVYFWYFNSGDGFGGISTENIAVTVSNVPLSITSSSPAGDPATTVGTSQAFGITLNRIASVTWYINGSIVQANSSVVSADYTNSTAGIGEYNVTAIADDSYYSASRTWNWTVIPQPTYNVSGYVSDNYGSGLGSVLVQNGSNQSTTLASGYYLITGLLNGTYNLSYSKANFNTGYLEVTVNGADNTSANKTIYDTTPPASVYNATSTAGSFYINNTWTNPIDADFNHTWFRYGNGTNLQNVSSPVSYLNITWLPHYIQNISAQAVDTYGNINQTMVWFNATIPNNAPIQATIGNKIVNEGGLLAFTVSATDIDTDAITYGTNTTKGTFNTTTGEFSWIPGYGDAGTYMWYFNSSDSYGGIANEIITVTVNNVLLSITSSSPVSDPTTIVDTAQTFVVDLNRTADVTWYVNGSAIQTNSSIISASYTNSTAGIGVYNITAIISDSYDSASRTWYWTVIPKPTYNVSGYVFDIHGSGLESVQVQNNSKQSTTEVSGHYLITGLLNGTYNFSYSKAGFNTGYLEITISGSDINNANLTIYDTTPPDSVTNPATVTGSFYINNTWINPADADFSHTWLKYGNDTTLQNVSSTISHLNLTWLPHYTQNISAQTVDTYDNVNQTKVWFNVTIPNNVPVQSQIENKTVAAGDLLTFTVSATDADSDEITYGTNATKGALNSSTGVYLWTTTSSDVGTYIWSFNSTDGYGGVDNETITVTVNPPPAYIPPVPSYLSGTQGNFWINHTWQEGAGNKTDSYNISVNGVWTNGTNATYSNNNVGAHGWSNISVWAYNNSGSGSLSLTSISQSTQVNNNAPIQSQVGDLIVTAGDPLTFTITATDEDSDVITYGTNATKGTLDPLTGEYSWSTTGSDIGTYIWSFSSTDGYGGVDNEIITLTVTAQSSPANQNMGVKDTLFADYTENMCRDCHTQGVTDYHHLLDNNKYSCSNCHPVNGSQITIVRDCKTCHGNTFNNLDIRRPHHETKNAQDRRCSFCHGSIVDDFDDEHYIPTYDLSFTSPSPHYKVINYTTGNKFGGCEACHKRNDTYVPRIYYDNETHHMLGNLSGFNPQNSSKCEACHENNGLYEFDSIRYCQKCHSVKSLHNMQHDYINTSNSSGHGHIGSDRDCNGCHAFWVTADIKPAIDSIIPTVDTISTSKINAGNNTTLTINGDNFLHSANISVVILVNDTYNMTLYPDSLNDTEIAVTIPSLEKGRYGIYILKNGKVKSNRRPIISVPEAIIDSAKKSGTAIPIRGSGFGYYDPAYINFTNVTITTIDKKGVVTYRRVQIDDWNDTLINIHSTDAAAGDNVTVNSVFGSNSTKVTR
ncbi:IPT/TIG domain-containing protein [Candidatus Methanoperedens nitratireducens]|uniref:IPT/TIG domain-containing protein n=1 Tax=Candidatus Methanoperedens nitratireducens TaxID=1392998 RepID=A0A284VMI7_9EURY|nr:IPT/TIG domain-containing protein [Candidatus Methanoperedens nitroreducens]SNQ60491.1 hypothetical protein MNV_1840016 [Candidatus Methanoperedens nitroreducens]